jgi:hypothetical protein
MRGEEVRREERVGEEREQIFELREEKKRAVEQ